jgi:hypothetical protein
LSLLQQPDQLALTGNIRHARKPARGRGRVVETCDETITYDEVRENTPPLIGKGKQEWFPHLWEPPPGPESRSPAADHDHGAPKEDRLRSTIEIVDTAASENIQASICEHCGESFEPRKRSGGKPQRFCSTACRKAAHANVPSVPKIPGADVGEDIGKDVGKNPNVGQSAIADLVRAGAPAELVGRVANAFVPAPAPKAEDDSEEFRWNDEDTVVPSQPAIAVYFNPRRDIVIRQESYDDDRWIYINRQNLHLLIRRLQEIAETGE